MQRDLGALREQPSDVLIVGGGIYGACLAWEAAQRGLRTALVEAGDFGCGTSWNSLKTIHGGIRHLQRLDLASFRESVRERRALLRIAGGLVQPLSFLLPLYGHGMKGREAFAVGLAMNRVLGMDRNDDVPDDRRLDDDGLLDPADVKRLAPQIAMAGLTGGARWTDAQARSTERLVLAFLHQAASAGALLANDARVDSLLREDGRVVGARVVDERTGGVVEARATLVLNAAGPRSAAIAAGAGSRMKVPFLRAVNILFDRAPELSFALGGSDGDRLLFLVPWNGKTLLGTAYGPADVPVAALAASLLGDAARAFPWASFRESDVALVHDGFVPGERDASGLWSRNLVVDHEAFEALPGLVSVVGAKYTTARAAAEAVVDLSAKRLRRRIAKSRTAEIPLARLVASGATLAERTGFAIREEMAERLDDLVLRRLDLGTGGPPSRGDVDLVAAVLSRAMGWSEERRKSEVESLMAAWPHPQAARRATA